MVIARPGALSAAANPVGEHQAICGRAFRDLTGVHLGFAPVQTGESGWCAIVDANAFCQLMGRDCPGCSEFRGKLFAANAKRKPSASQARSVQCAVGLTAAAAPAIAPDGAPGVIYAGPVILQTEATDHLIESIVARIMQIPRMGSNDPLRQLISAVPVISLRKWQAVLLLLPSLAGNSQSVPGQTRPSTPTSDRGPDCVSRALRLIGERFRDDLGLAPVAREVGASACHLSRQFHLHTGTSFSQWVRDARVAELKRLLLESDVNITTAIFDAGFQTVSQANRAFRSVVGISPREYRGQANR